MMERELARRRMALALEQIEGYGVLMLDTEGAVIERNPSIGRLFGKPDGQGAGEPLLDWVAQAEAKDAVPSFSELRAAVQRQGCVQSLLPWRHAGGQLLWGECVVTALVESDGGISGHVAVVRDVTEDPAWLDHDRHRPLQARQRPPWPRRRRQRAQGGGRIAAVGGARR